MNTSSHKLQCVEVESYDILDLVDKTPESLMEMFDHGREVHLCVTHRDLRSEVRLQMVQKSCGVIVSSILMLSQKLFSPDYQTLIQINEGVTGYLEESLNSFKQARSDLYIQMDMRLLIMREGNNPITINTKTSFIDVSGNYKSLNIE